ncbi:MAG: adenylate kinase [Bacillota bacterium]
MNLIFLGLPGAGKGTQAKKLEEDLNIPHIATGDIFRKAIKEETPLGKKAKSYIDSGELVPDEVTIGIVRERLNEDDCKNGFILDGFPRTINQAESLDKILADLSKKIDMVIYLKAEISELVKRLSGRRVCPNCGATYHIHNNPPQKEGICDKCGTELIQRSDDKEETVKRRIEVNKEKINKLINYYDKKSLLYEVQSTGGIDKVHSHLLSLIEENNQ